MNIGRLSRTDVERLLKKGARSRDPIFTLYSTFSEKRKLGVSVSKKIAPKATARNLIKRKVREVARKSLPNNTEVLLVVLKDIRKERHDKLVESIENLFNKTKNSLRVRSY